jgi:putative membrane protein
LNPQLSTGSVKTARIAIIIIIIFHVVGIIGFSLSGFDTMFLNLVPWHLLLMMAVITWAHNRPDAKFGLFALLLFTLSFGAELIGVHTGWLFGSYTYGDTLGIKLFSVPLMIGVNWLLLIYATGVLMQRSRVKNIYARVFAGALLLVVLDVLIEPIAIHFDYWHWTSGTVPIQNYVCWFALSALMLFVFEKFKFPPQSKAGPVLLVMEFVFFMMLGMLN